VYFVCEKVMHLRGWGKFCGLNVYPLEFRCGHCDNVQRWDLEEMSRP
jgi:hypothetical protein